MLKSAIVRKLTLLLGTVVVTLVILELVVRAFFPQSVAVPWQDEVGGITAPRPSVHGRHAIPGTFDVTLSFNSQRFRGTKEFTQTPAAGSVRLATLGDSFTLGYGANDDQTYPANLERRLQNKQVEVINAANAGTGTGEQALWYDLWVKQFHPQIVILTVTSNDLDDDAARHLFTRDEKGNAVPLPRQPLRVSNGRRIINAVPGYSYLAEHSQLWGLIRNALSAALAPKATNPNGGLQMHEQGLPLMESEVSWLNDHVRLDKSFLVVAFAPSRESIYPSNATWAETTRSASAEIVSSLSALCKEKNIPFVDLTPKMKENGAGNLYYDGLDTHPTPAGYKLMADILSDFLINQKLPPLEGR